MLQFDLIVVGGGAAGMAAAITAKENGIEKILILEREAVLGGALNEYIHVGFGVDTFGEELTGPEFSQRLIDKAEALGIDYKLNTTVIEIKKDKKIIFVNNKDGILEIQTKALILATGCREKPKGAISIPRSRCSGIFTAGSAHKFVNVDGYLPGKRVVILGSNDMGAIIARRLIIEGAKIEAVIDHMPNVTASERNIVQCFENFNIQFLLSTTIIDIKGKDRIEGVTIVKVDENRKIIMGTEEEIGCDSLILAVSLFPEVALLKEMDAKMCKYTKGIEVDNNMNTSSEGVFACGSAVHIHNFVDDVYGEAVIAGKNAADYINKGNIPVKRCKVIPMQGIKYIVPQHINLEVLEENIEFKYKVDHVYEQKYICVYIDGKQEIKIKKEQLIEGTIEKLAIPKSILSKYEKIKNITFSVEDENI